MTTPADPLRRVAAERGRILGELGVRPQDARWAKLEAESIAGLVTPGIALRIPPRLARLFRRIRRVLR